MKRTVRFVEDDTPYCAGDFGDNGDRTMQRVEAGEVVVLGMVTFDADTLSDDDGIPLETRVSDARLDSVWCIDVASSALDDTGRDWTADNVDDIRNDYLRYLAHGALCCQACEGGIGNMHAFEAAPVT